MQSGIPRPTRLVVAVLALLPLLAASYPAAGQSAIVSLTLDPDETCGTLSSTGTVTLDGPAPAGGVVVALSSSNTTVAQVPADVTVTEGESSATFSITTSPVSETKAVGIGATLGGATTTAVLLVKPLLASVTLNPDTVCATLSSVGTVRLNCPAPAGGVLIALASSDTAVAQVPASVLVEEGETTATFPVTTGAVTREAHARISATAGGVIRLAKLRVRPLLVGLKLSPPSVCGGQSSRGIVRLNCPAPAGGILIALASSDTVVAQVPASVLVEEGKTTAAFEITTSAVASNTNVRITASYGGVRKQAILNVRRPFLASLKLDPGVVKGGEATTLTATLNCPAPAGGAAVALSSSHPAIAPVPTSLTIPAGAKKASITITTSAVARQTDVKITGVYGGAIRSAKLMVKP